MLILDPTCSARSIWFDKINPHVIHCDIRVADLSYTPGDDTVSYFLIGAIVSAPVFPKVTAS